MCENPVRAKWQTEAESTYMQLLLWQLRTTKDLGNELAQNSQGKSGSKQTKKNGWLKGCKYEIGL